MRFSTLAAATLSASLVNGHGVITYMRGANGVDMPGLTVIEGTPRDCPSNGCGSQADTAIIRERELGTGRASALGRTQGGGPVDAAAAVANFMGTSGGAQNNGNNGNNGNNRNNKRQLNLDKLLASIGEPAGAGKDVQQEAAAEGVDTGALTGVLSGILGNLGGKGQNKVKRSGLLQARQFLSRLLGGNRGGANTSTRASSTDTSPAALMPGVGATSGLPTCSDNGVVSMTYHQINQDGAGPLTAMIDPTSGGTDPSAFVAAQMINDVPGIAAGFSATTVQDFDISAQMPQGMVCEGRVAGQTGVCVMRINNVTPAGPFGGSVAFVQSNAARKRALEYLRLKKRHFARGLVEN